MKKLLLALAIITTMLYSCTTTKTVQGKGKHKTVTIKHQLL